MPSPALITLSLEITFVFMLFALLRIDIAEYEEKLSASANSAVAFLCSSCVVVRSTILLPDNSAIGCVRSIAL